MVVFFIAVLFIWITTIGSVATSLNNQNNEPYLLCLNTANQQMLNTLGTGQNFDIGQANAECSSLDVGNWQGYLVGLIFGTVCAIIFYYLLQVIYFVILYPVGKYIAEGSGAREGV